MSEINQIYVGENKEFFTIADTAARNQIANLDRVVVTPLPSHPQITTGDTIDTAFSKTEAQFEALGDMAFKDNLTKSDVTSALNYDPEAKDNEMKQSFQAGVDMMVTACRAKGSAPAGDPPYTPQAVSDAIMAIQTGGNYGTLEVNADGTYDVSQDPRGLDAYDVVVVSKDVGQPHIVTFYDIDGTTILKVQANVPYHGYASCTALDGTIVNGLYFKGWNPAPTNVIRDMDCYPQFGDYVIKSGEIEDDWETICSNNGSRYDLGSYKPLVFTMPAHTFDITRTSPTGTEYNWSVSIPQQNISMHMYKVAEGEDNSTSTWLSSGLILGRIQYLTSFSFDSFLKTEMAFDWANIPLREWLNTIFLGQLPSSLQNTIKQVNKSYIGAINYYPGAKSNPTIEKTCLDRIWIPSLRELYTKINSYPNFGGIDREMHRVSLSSYAEVNGIDYSTVYTPTYSMDNNHGYFLRSAVYAVTHGAGGGASDRGTEIGVLHGTSPYDNYSPTYILGNSDTNMTNNSSVPFGFCL